MANKRVRDLTDGGAYNDDYYVEVDAIGFAEAHKMKLVTVTGVEAAARVAQDDIIEASCGLETDGSYDTNDGSNYIRGADFIAAGETACLKGADNLLDAKIKEIEDIVLGIGQVTTVTVDVLSPAPNVLNGAPYNLLGHPIADTAFTGYRIFIIDAYARIDYTAPAVEVGTDTLNLRYSDGTTIGTWTNPFYESTADGTQRISLVANAAIPDVSCVQLYCASNSSGTPNSDIYITLVYMLELI